MSGMRGRLTMLGWLAMLLVGWIVVPRTAAVEENDSEQLVVYPLITDSAVRYRLFQQDDPRIRVLVWLETPRPEVLNEEESWLFGFSMTTSGPHGDEEREHWTRSRLTVLDEDGLAVESELADRVVTDSRIIDIEPAGLRQGGTLTIKPLGLEADQRLMVRVLERRPENPLLKRLPERVVEKLARTYPMPWPGLRDSERQWHLARWHQALGPEDSPDGVQLTVWAEPSWAPTSVDEGYRLGPGESTAVNLRGPATLWVDSTWESSGLEASLIPEVVATEEVEGGELGARKVVVPEGTTWSLRWHNGWRADAAILRFTVDPDQGQSFGEPPGASGAQPQEPERRRITVYRAGPERQSIEVPVDGGRSWGVLRVEARPLAPETWLEDPTQELTHGVTVNYRVLDEEGDEMHAGSWEAPYIHAPFERYVEISEARRELFPLRNDIFPWRAEDEPVSERDVRYLYHRKGARTVIFEADGLVDLRFLAPLEVEPVIAPEYGVPDTFSARYHPWEFAPYVTIGPLNHEALVLAEQLFRFDATVRIEPKGQDDDGLGSEGLRTWLVRPIEEYLEHPAFEKVRSRANWRPWFRTLLGREVTLNVGPDGVEVDHRGELGTLNVECGEHKASAELVATAGRVLLNLPEGRHECTVDSPEARLLAQAEGGGTWYAWRSLYRADGRTLTIRVPKNDPVEKLFIRLYTFESTPMNPIEVLVDGGSPAREFNAHSYRTPDRAYRTPTEIKGSASLVNGGELVAWRGVQVTLGDDLPEGSHTITVRVPRGRAVLARFDATWVDPRGAGARHWVEAER
jgi:hypothetical protein